MIQDLMSESQNHSKNLNNLFKKNLDDIEYPSQKQKNELWNISGILKNGLNQKLKFDTKKNLDDIEYPSQKQKNELTVEI